MAFTDLPHAGDKLARAFGTMAVGGAILFAWNSDFVGNLTGRNSPEAVAEQVEDALRSTPETEALYTTMESRFPQEYAGLVQTVGAAATASRDADAVAATGNRYMDDFFIANVPNLQRAPDSAINALRDDSIRVIEQLAEEDVTLCARFAMQGLRPGDVTSPDLRALLNATVLTQVSAMADGRDTPTERAQPSEADLTAYAASLDRRGMSPAQINGLMAGDGSLLRQSVEDQCQSGVKTYQSLADLPADQSARIGAILLVPAL